MVAYLFFRFLGKSWIESKFSQNLELFRHQQALELQRLRVEIDALLSGALKLQQKEFEYLPIAWVKLDIAYSSVSALVSPSQKYPALDRMTPAELEEFLEKTELLDTQKTGIRNSDERVNAYREAIFWHQLHSVKKNCNDFHNYAVHHSIFFPPELKAKLTDVAEHLWQAISAKELATHIEDYKFQSDTWRALQKDISPLYFAIEKDIYARLQEHGRSSADCR